MNEQEVTCMRELKQDWRDIFLAFRIARDPRKVLLGAIGVVLSMIQIGRAHV